MRHLALTRGDPQVCPRCGQSDDDPQEVTLRLGRAEGVLDPRDVVVDGVVRRDGEAGPARPPARSPTALRLFDEPISARRSHQIRKKGIFVIRRCTIANKMHMQMSFWRTYLVPPMSPPNAALLLGRARSGPFRRRLNEKG